MHISIKFNEDKEITVLGVAWSSSVSLSVLLLVDGSTFTNHSWTFKVVSGIVVSGVRDSENTHIN